MLIAQLGRSKCCKLTFDLLTLKVVSESRVTWATSVPNLVFLGLSVLDLGSMYATDKRTSDRQTSDVRRVSSLNASTLRGRGHNKANNTALSENDFRCCRSRRLVTDRYNEARWRVHGQVTSRRCRATACARRTWNRATMMTSVSRGRDACLWVGTPHSATVCPATGAGLFHPPAAATAMTSRSSAADSVRSLVPNNAPVRSATQPPRDFRASTGSCRKVARKSRGGRIAVLSRLQMGMITCLLTLTGQLSLLPSVG